jgi:hypothetical protein
VTLHLPHPEGRDALLAELDSWQQLLGAFDDVGAPSRCAGWNCGQLLVHVHLGLHEVALALLDVREPGPVTIDAAGYWTKYPRTTDTERQDRMLEGFAASYPSGVALAQHLGETVEALRRGVAGCPEGRIAFQDFTFGTGDFLGSWAVELAVHHLDLDVIGSPPTASALALTRACAESLVGDRLPATWDDATAVLVATGRVPVRDETLPAHLRNRLPVIG